MSLLSTCSLIKCAGGFQHLPHGTQILGNVGSTVETRFGTASVLRYPATVCLSERGTDKGSALRDAKRIVEVRATTRQTKEEARVLRYDMVQCGAVQCGVLTTKRVVSR